MPRRKRVYISGPMTIGKWEENIRQAEEAAKRLRDVGFSVLCPQLTGKMTGHSKIPHDVWIENDLSWVECAELILRISGESRGADAECNHAKSFSIPIYHNIEELIENVHPVCLFR